MLLGHLISEPNHTKGICSTLHFPQSLPADRERPGGRRPHSPSGPPSSPRKDTSPSPPWLSEPLLQITSPDPPRPQLLPSAACAFMSCSRLSPPSDGRLLKDGPVPHPPQSFRVTPSAAELATAGTPCPTTRKLVSLCTFLGVNTESRSGEAGPSNAEKAYFSSVRGFKI